MPYTIRKKNRFKTSIYILVVMISLLAATVAGGTTGTVEHRVALVIGNSNYENSPLRNPVNDARAMGNALKAVGFDVMTKVDLNQKEMKRAIDEFGSKLNNQSVALFYFAGHGMQVKGHNYLIPIATAISTEQDVEYEAVRADRVLAKMNHAQPRVNIVILDACRNNPFARSFRSAGQGLAHMDAPSGTIIAYATAPGSVASDGSGENGLYTQELVKYIHAPGLPIENVFKKVRAGVRRESDAKQTPWESSSLIGNFYFNGTNTGQPSGTVNPVPEPGKAEPATPDIVMGSLSVTCNVDDASFVISGREIKTRTGGAVTVDKIPAGPHTITVKKNGYTDWHSTVVVQKNAVAKLDVNMIKISPQAKKSPEPSGNTRAFLDPVLNFGVKVPKTWVVQNFQEGTDRVFVAMSPDQNAVLRIRAFQVPPGANLVTIRSTFESMVQASVLGYTGQTVEVTPNDTLNNIPGQSAVYQGYYNGVPMQLVAFYTIHGQIGHVVWTMIPQSLFDQRIGEVLTIAESFTPAGG